MIRRSVTGAKALVERAGIVLSSGFWKARKAVAPVGKAVKEVGQKLEGTE